MNIFVAVICNIDYFVSKHILIFIAYIRMIIAGLPLVASTWIGPWVALVAQLKHSYHQMPVFTCLAAQ